MFPGIVVAFAGNHIPKGWLECDGRLLHRKEYSELFEAIGAIHGGDADEHFRVPDYRGRFLRGWDHGAGRDPQARERKPASDGDINVGNRGDNVGSLQDDDFTRHGHHFLTRFLEAQGGNGFGGGGTESNSGQPDTWPHNIGTTEAGGSETRPKNVYVTYIIKY